MADEEGNEIISNIRKAVIFPAKFAHEHPLVLVSMFLAFMLHRYFPALFASLVSSSPVIVCTALLLGVVLVYGEPNTCERTEISPAVDPRSNEEKKKKKIHGKKEKKKKKAMMSKDVEILYQGFMERREISVAENSLMENEDDDASSSGSECERGDDMVPIIDELHPLLNSEPCRPAHASSSSENDDSDELSAGEEVENREEDEEEEEDDDEEEGPEKDDGNEVAVKWTADDQKNLMDLGTLELERNQRLENLIAKRIAKKRFETEKNLIDLDSSENSPTVLEPLHGLHIQIHHRRNPFDLPYDSDDAGDLPPAPGSAPSILLPRPNPFDLPEDEASAATNKQPELLAPFRRHESFCVGPSFTGELRAERRSSRFRPYFVPEKMISEEADFTALQRQSSGQSDSKASSVPESDTASSIVDREDAKDVEEQESHHDDEGENDDDDGREGSTVDMEDEHRVVDAAVARDHQDVDEIEESFGGDGSASMSSSSSITGDEQANGSSVSLKSVASESNNLGTHAATESGEDGQVVDPVYDSSPSAVEKSLSNMVALQGDVPHEGEGGMSSYPTSPASDLHVETSEFGGSSPAGHITTMAEEIIHRGEEAIWVASPSLNFVEENESRSREVSVIREHDVLSIAIPPPVGAGDVRQAIVPVLPERIALRMSGRRHRNLSIDSSSDQEGNEDGEGGGKP